MKHFKLFLLPLLAMTLVFSSCEKQDLSLTYIEPIQDWGKSPQDILEKMTKSKSGATLEYSESDESDYYMEYENYGISEYLIYMFSNNRLAFCYTITEGLSFKQTIKDYCTSKFTLVQIEKDEDYEIYLYHNKKKTSSILLYIDEEGISQYYLPYLEGNIEDFLDSMP